MRICLFFVLISVLLPAQGRDAKQELKKARADRLGRGKQILQRAQRAMGGAEKLV